MIRNNGDYGLSVHYVFDKREAKLNTTVISGHHAVDANTKNPPINKQPYLTVSLTHGEKYHLLENLHNEA